MTHLLCRAHVKCVGLTGCCPCHSTIKTEMITASNVGRRDMRVCWSYSMLNKWILMDSNLFKRRRSSRDGGRKLCACWNASRLCHTRLHLLGPHFSFSLSSTLTFTHSQLVHVQFSSYSPYFALRNWIYATSLPLQKMQHFHFMTWRFCALHFTHFLLL